MKDKKPEIGDIVRLKSGGPEMTVKAYLDMDPETKYDDILVCCWFDNSLYKEETFDMRVLEIL